jgi:hypothetical protein
MSGYVVLTPRGILAQSSKREPLVFDTLRTAQTYVWGKDYDGRNAWSIYPTPPNTVDNGRLVTPTDLMRLVP